MTPFLERLAHGDGVLDIGAHTGAFTSAVARAVGDGGCVHAYEPNPQSTRHLAKLARVYPCVTVQAAAVTHRARPVDFYLGADPALASCARANVPDLTGALVVPSVTLDEAAAAVPRLRGIRLDARGAEGLMLRGAKACLARRDLVWMVDLWPEGLRALESSAYDLAQAFATRGWRVLATGTQLTLAAVSWEDVASRAAQRHGTSQTTLLIGV